MQKAIFFALVGGLLVGCGGSSGQTGPLVGTFDHGVLGVIDTQFEPGFNGEVVTTSGTGLISGVEAGYDVGAAYVSGTASYTGQYEMSVARGLEVSDDPDNWEISTLGGDISARIELHTAIAGDADPDHGHSHDMDVVELFIGNEGDNLYFDEVIIYSPSGPARPSTDIHDFIGGTATIDGKAVDLRGQVAFGSDGMIASFQGQDADHLVAGGFGLGATEIPDSSAE